MLKESYNSNKSHIKTTVICCAIGAAAAIVLMAAFAMAVVLLPNIKKILSIVRTAGKR